MRLAERIERWPIEEWAAAVSRTGRRLRRRAMRRRRGLAVAVATLALVAAVGGNALWRQTERHPAPLWGAPQDGVRQVIAGHGVSAAPANASSVGRTSVATLVERVQQALAADGFYTGAPTGRLDEETRAAIRRFEAARGLPETGEPSLALLAAMSEPAPSGGRVTQVAAPSPPELGVAEVQRLLNAKGFGPLAVDGKMGPRTQEALDRFAVAHGLSTRQGLSPALIEVLAGRDA